MFTEHTAVRLGHLEAGTGTVIIFWHTDQ